MTEAVLAAFSDAWTRHDIDALMSFMSEDCVFQAADGSHFEVNGLDLFAFKDAEIQRKNAFRKDRPDLPAAPRA